MSRKRQSGSGRRIPIGTRYAHCLVMAGFLTLHACGSPDDKVKTAQATVIDTSRITSYVARYPPVLSIGRTQGDERYTLFRVRAAVILSDHRIAIANGGTFELRFYNSDGTFQYSVGREGEGPGEFRMIRTVSRIRGDTIAIWDSRMHRLTLVAPDGSVPYSLTPNVQTSEGTWLGGNTWVSPQGSMIVLEEEMRLGDNRRGITRDPVSVIAVPRGEGSGVRIGPFEGTEWLRLGGSGVVRPFGHLFLMTSDANAIFVGTGKPGRIDRFGYDGEHLGGLIIPDSSVPVTEQDYIRASASLVSRTGSDAAKSRLRKTLSTFESPEWRPSYRDLRIDKEGRLWIKRFNSSWSEEQEWLIVDPVSARAIGRVRLPNSVRWQDADNETVVVLNVDDFGVEQILLLPLVKDVTRPEP